MYYVTTHRVCMYTFCDMTNDLLFNAGIYFTRQT